MLIFDLGCSSPLKLWEFDLRVHRAIMPPKRGTCTAIFSEDLLSVHYINLLVVFLVSYLMSLLQVFSLFRQDHERRSKIYSGLIIFIIKEVQSYNFTVSWDSSLKEVKHTLQTLQYQTSFHQCTPH